MERQQKMNLQADALKAKIRRAGANLDSGFQYPFALVSKNPLESLGVALALGLVFGKFPNASHKILELFVNQHIKR